MIKKAASAIGKNATKIDLECDSINATIRRVLTEALTALEVTQPVSDARDNVGGAA